MNELSVRAQFEIELQNHLKKIEESSRSQFEHDLRNNIPNAIAGVNLENVVNHSIQSGTVNAIGKFIKWEPDAAILWAHHILEDVNFHEAARKLVEFIPEYQ